MAYKHKRKLVKVGKTSKAVILPKPWLDYHGEAAEFLTLFGDKILIIAAQGDEEKARWLSDLAEKGGD